MSKIEVDAIEPQSGTTLTLGDGGDTIDVPGTEIKTNKISPTSGTTLTLGDSGDTITIPSGATLTNSGTATGFGKVLQVVQTVKDTSYSSSSTSFVDVTGLSASITPSSASNKILITCSFVTSQTGNHFTIFNLLRGATNIGQPATSQSFTGTRSSYLPDTGNGIMNVHIQFLDSPSTTSATTYKIQARCNSGTLRMGNRQANDSEQISIITLMEIAG
jgi:hypothetical protein